MPQSKPTLEEQKELLRRWKTLTPQQQAEELAETAPEGFVPRMAQEGQMAPDSLQGKKDELTPDS